MSRRNVDGVIGINLSQEKQLATAKRFDAFQTFGVPAYLLCLYGLYAGFFAAMLTIAVYAREDNYLSLASRLTGTPASPDTATTPWVFLASSMRQ